MSVSPLSSLNSHSPPPLFVSFLPVIVMNTQGEKGVDSRAEHSRCLFRLCRRQKLWSQAGNGHTQVDKQAGESKLGLKALTGSHKRAWKMLSRVQMKNNSQRHKQNDLN